MEHELKIVMKTDEQGKFHFDTKIYFDGIVVGVVQDFKMQVSVDNQMPEIEITFPDFRNMGLAETYFNDPMSLVHDVDSYVEALTKIPNIKVILK